MSAALFPVLVGLLFGRIWCGWMCPYHLLADATAWLRGLFRGKALKKTSPDSLVIADSFKANSVRYGFLVIGTMLAGVTGIPLLNYLSAPGILSTEAMIFVKERTLTLEFGFIAVLLLLELVALPRFWCRLFCPTGSLLALFRAPFGLKVAAGVKTPRSACCSGRHCSDACPMGLAAFREGGNLLCTNCGRCLDACRSGHGGGRLRFNGFFRN